MAAGFTNEGLTAVIGNTFCNVTQQTAWYLGLINNSPSPTFAATDTLNPSGRGWAEVPFSTGYTGNRPAWGNGAPSSNATTNASTVNFAMLGTYTVYGLLIASHATAVTSSSSQRLAATAAFSGGTQAVASGDTLQCTATISAASG